MGLIFLPKIVHIYKTPNLAHEIYDGGVGRRSGISNSSGYDGSSTTTTLHNLSSNYKSDQNCFQQLMKENLELKRQIELVNIQIFIIKLFCLSFFLTLLYSSVLYYFY